MSNFTDYDGKKLDKSGVEAVPDDLSPNNSQSENSDYVLYTYYIHNCKHWLVSVFPEKAITTNCKHVFDKTCI